MGILCLQLLSNSINAQTLYEPGDILVSNRGADRVGWFDSLGNSKGTFVSAGSGGLSRPQEIVMHPSGDILVTGRFNDAIKRYDGLTGDFIGDFTTGYSLDEPTKTQVGPDSLLYVAQWGTQNKIARFDIYTGAFVDEITEVGVFQGMGMAWTSSGIWYVCSWNDGSNGFVQAFTEDGTDLGFLLDGSDLDGPVNIWFDRSDSSELWISDWTRGEVLVYDFDDNAIVDTPVTGLAALEGFAWDAQGRLYLGDWAANRIYRYHYDTDNLELFINGSGLSNPNGLFIVPYPKATEPPTGLGDIVQQSGPQRFEVYILQGQLLHQGVSEDARQIPNLNLASGVYLLKMGKESRWLHIP
jgi:streptogramin lyase